MTSLNQLQSLKAQLNKKPMTIQIAELVLVPLFKWVAY